MDTELVRALCALAAFVLPLGFAWLVVTLGERRKRNTVERHSARDATVLRSTAASTRKANHLGQP